MMFASLFKHFGSLGKAKQRDEESKPDTIEEQIHKSIEDFKNRPIYKSLTTNIIDTTPDDDLVQSIFDILILRFPKDYTKEYQTVLGWTKSQQAIYITWYLEAEVNNGGFNQFYYNPGGQYAGLIPGALELIGASNFADLTIRANEVYQRENDKITRQQDGSLAGFSKSYDDNPLNKFDEEFHVLNKGGRLQNIQVDYIRNHKEDFIDN